MDIISTRPPWQSRPVTHLSVIFSGLVNGSRSLFRATRHGRNRCSNFSLDVPYDIVHLVLDRVDLILDALDALFHGGTGIKVPCSNGSSDVGV